MISVILLNYNNTFHTIPCLKSLERQTYKEFEIVLIEHDSNHEYREELYNFLKSDKLNRKFKDKINLIQLEENHGFTWGCNVGISHSKGDIILLLNNDTFHEPDFLKSMQSFFKKYEFVHIAQPKINQYPRKDLIWQNGGKIKKYSYDLFSGIDNMKKENEIKKNPFEIDYAVGTALFIRRSVLDCIGLLDTDYYMYCEECDLCYRARLNGFNSIYCNPKAKIYHNRKLGFSKISKKYLFRNRIIFCFKFFPIFLVLWQLMMQFIEIFLYTYDFKEKKLDYKFFFGSIKGILNGVKIGIRKRINN